MVIRSEEPVPHAQVVIVNCNTNLCHRRHYINQDRVSKLSLCMGVIGALLLCVCLSISACVAQVECKKPVCKHQTIGITNTHEAVPLYVQNLPLVFDPISVSLLPDRVSAMAMRKKAD